MRRRESRSSARRPRPPGRPHIPEMPWADKSPPPAARFSSSAFAPAPDLNLLRKHGRQFAKQQLRFGIIIRRGTAVFAGAAANPQRRSRKRHARHEHEQDRRLQPIRRRRLRRGQRSAVRGQESGVRGRRSGVWGQRSRVGGSIIHAQEVKHPDGADDFQDQRGRTGWVPAPLCKNTRTNSGCQIRYPRNSSGGAAAMKNPVM